MSNIAVGKWHGRLFRKKHEWFIESTGSGRGHCKAPSDHKEHDVLVGQVHVSSSRWPNHEYGVAGKQGANPSRSTVCLISRWRSRAGWPSGDESQKEISRARAGLSSMAKSQAIRKIKKSAMPCSMLITVGDGPG